ncbi:MAG: SDR family NAD(P)-dependent oxidoreductase [Thermodesulfobacteriota bacterium]
MNRIVIVTGSTRGIGFFTATEFLKARDRVAIFCRHKKHVTRAMSELTRLTGGKDILGLVGDVRRKKDVKKVVRQCLKRFGRIDILINNAGIAVYKELEKISQREWDDILDTNLKGCFLFMREVIPVMKKQGEGIIINISSGLGVSGEAKFSAYCASKFGVIGLTQSVADETAESGLRIYAVLPGAVNTKLNWDLDLGMEPEELLAPEHVARKIFELAEGKRRSGQSLTVYS